MSKIDSGKRYVVGGPQCIHCKTVIGAVGFCVVYFVPKKCIEFDQSRMHEFCELCISEIKNYAGWSTAQSYFQFEATSIVPNGTVRFNPLSDPGLVEGRYRDAPSAAGLNQGVKVIDKTKWAGRPAATLGVGTSDVLQVGMTEQEVLAAEKEVTRVINSVDEFDSLMSDIVSADHVLPASREQEKLV